MDIFTSTGHIHEKFQYCKRTKFFQSIAYHTIEKTLVNLETLLTSEVINMESYLQKLKKSYCKFKQ